MGIPRAHRRAEAFHRLSHAATLDALLANRLPNVELLTVGGPGVAILAASYATERGLSITAHLPEFGRFPERAAIERRDTEVVALADAAVIVLAEKRDPAILRLLERVNAKGFRFTLSAGRSPRR